VSRYYGRASKREQCFRAACVLVYLAAFAAAVGWLAHWLGII
jgi:hypothetical protein